MIGIMREIKNYYLYNVFIYVYTNKTYLNKKQQTLIFISFFLSMFLVSFCNRNIMCVSIYQTLIDIIKIYVYDYRYRKEKHRIETLNIVSTAYNHIPKISQNFLKNPNLYKTNIEYKELF